MKTCLKSISRLFQIIALISLFFLFIISCSSESLASYRCESENLYGIVWSVDGCSCSGDTISNTRIGAYAEDSIGYSRGWIDARDLTCDSRTGHWKVKDKPKFATCSGCKAGYGANGTCGPASQKLHSSKPAIGLCTCGTPSSVKKVGQAWQWSCGDGSSNNAVNCIAPAKPR